MCKCNCHFIFTSTPLGRSIQVGSLLDLSVLRLKTRGVNKVLLCLLRYQDHVPEIKPYSFSVPGHGRRIRRGRRGVSGYLAPRQQYRSATPGFLLAPLRFVKLPTALQGNIQWKKLESQTNQVDKKKLRFTPDPFWIRWSVTTSWHLGIRWTMFF